MNRNDFYFKQLVTEAELDDAFDDVENAMWNLAIDIGLFGVVSGAVGTEDAPQSMNIKLSTGCRAYDQLGRRIYYGPEQLIDCSQDELGNATVPGAGLRRSITVAIEQDRVLSDLRVDGNGANVYYDRDESFNVRVINGATIANPGPSVDPTKPSDALTLCDIVILDTTLVITNAMIEIDRRDDFVWTTADKIGVTAGAWTKLDAAAVTVEDALDSTDNELLSRDGSGDLDADLTFAAGKDVGTAAKPFMDGRGTNFVSYKSTIAGAYAMSAARTVTKKKIPFGLVRHATDWVWTNSGTYGARLVKGYIFNSAGGNVVAQLPLVGLPNGATLTHCYLTWFEDTTNTSTARLWRKDLQGVGATIGAAATKTTANAWDDDQAVDPTAPALIDLHTYEYYMEIIGPTAGNPMVAVAASMTYTITDVGLAGAG